MKNFRDYLEAATDPIKAVVHDYDFKSKLNAAIQNDKNKTAELKRDELKKLLVKALSETKYKDNAKEYADKIIADNNRRNEIIEFRDGWLELKNG